ncbi:MAG: GAF domain-containing protein [Candidatus Zixiibacteriota bacterium]|nr:MAG: GAF domain-containing protein [candidate division Zixibacteria bacterium]
MKRENTRSDSRSGRGAQPPNLRILTSRILEFADSGIPRAQFFKELARMMIEFTGCDVARLVLRDQGRAYRCELTRDTSTPFRFDVVSGADRKEETPAIWSQGTAEALERLCCDIIDKQTDPSLPWFTAHGSLWTGDIDSLRLPGLRKSDDESGFGIRIDRDCASVALIPIEARNERIGLLQLVSATADRFSESEVEKCEQLAQTLGVALAHRRLQLALRERVKELTCLYGIARLAARPEISMERLLKEAVALLPPGWLYPDSACARIVLGERTFATGNYRKAVQSMKADLVVDGREAGFVEVGYIWEKPTLDEGPFLTEERNLIDTVANELSIIVEQKQAEAERSQLEDQLRHADRLATIGQLGAGLAHELNEPLANILGFAQLAAKDRSVADQTRQDLEKIVAASLHAREVIAKLLVFARQTTPEKTLVNINRLVEDGLYFLQSRCKKAGIELVRNLAAGLPEITADRPQLLQVLTNLAVNSLQAMPDGGVLTISTDFVDNHVRLMVEDTGVGMSDEIMTNIFNPFFTTKDVDQGTGLGLSVVHGIVTAHGGTVDVESAVGKGAKFTIRLPVEKTDIGKREDRHA